MAWLKFDDEQKSQLLVDRKGKYFYVLRDDAHKWQMKLQRHGRDIGVDLESWELASDGFVYFLIGAPNKPITPALSVETMTLILRARDIRPWHG